jgi:hypothetical protein
MARKKKAPDLQPYRKPKAQLYTVEVYCWNGERMAAPVKRIKHCMVCTNEQDSVGTVAILYEFAKYEEVARLIMCHVQLRQDGTWIYGVEDEESTTFKTNYQVWFLLPEPNEYSEEKKDDAGS